MQRFADVQVLVKVDDWPIVPNTGLYPASDDADETMATASRIVVESLCGDTTNVHRINNLKEMLEDLPVAPTSPLRRSAPPCTSEHQCIVPGSACALSNNLFAILSDEIVLRIMRFLPPRSMRALGVTCQRLHALSQDMSNSILPALHLPNLTPGPDGGRTRGFLLAHQKESVRWMIRREAGMLAGTATSPLLLRLRGVRLLQHPTQDRRAECAETHRPNPVAVPSDACTLSQISVGHSNILHSAPREATSLHETVPAPLQPQEHPIATHAPDRVHAPALFYDRASGHVIDARRAATFPTTLGTGGCLCDEPGMGKTVTVLAFLLWKFGAKSRGVGLATLAQLRQELATVAWVQLAVLDQYRLLKTELFDKLYVFLKQFLRSHKIRGVRADFFDQEHPGIVGSFGTYLHAKFDTVTTAVHKLRSMFTSAMRLPDASADLVRIGRALCDKLEELRYDLELRLAGSEFRKQAACAELKTTCASLVVVPEHLVRRFCYVPCHQNHCVRAQCRDVHAQVRGIRSGHFVTPGS